MSDPLEPVPPPEPSMESIRELTLGAQRRKRRTLLVLLAIPVVCAVGGVGWWQLSERQARREIGQAWSAVSSCLVGPSLPQGMRASVRMRAIQLAAIRTERELKSEARWPSRCADAVAQLYETMRRHGQDQDGAEGLAKRAEEFGALLRKTETMNDVSAQADGLFEAAAARSLVAEAATLPNPPPEPVAAPSLDTLPEAARITPLQYTLDRVSAPPLVDTALHLLIYDQHVNPAPILCTFTASGDDHCRTLGGELQGKAGLALGGTTEEGASPLVFVGPDGDQGIYRSDSGQRVTAMRAESAYVAKSGYVAIAGFPIDEHGTFELVQQSAPGAPLEKATIEAKDFEPKSGQIHRREILWDKLLVQILDPDSDKSRPRLQYLPLPAKGAKPKFVDIAPLDWVNASIIGCRTPDTTVVRIGLDQGFITFFADGRWSTPVPVESFPPAFGCDRGEAVFTNALGGQQRCTPAGCHFSEGQAPAYEPFQQREGAMADLNGKILSVALTDRRGGVRYRHADGQNLVAVGQDRLLLDDLVKDGKVEQDSTVLGMRLAGRGRFAVLLLSTPAGVYAMRFDADGKPTPANLKR